MTTSMNWNAQAGSGPELYQALLVPRMFRPFGELLVSALEPAPGSRALDVACGTGALSRLLAAAIGPAGSVVGVDLGPPMLEVARAQPAQDGAAPIDYVQGSADELPVDDGDFDLVTCQQGLQFFPDRPAALAELRRAMRDGATLAIATWTNLTGTPLFDVVAEALHNRVSTEAGEMMRSPWGLSDLAALEQMVSDAGFSNVSGRAETLEVTFPADPDFVDKLVQAGPIGALYLAADAGAQAGVVADVAAGLEPHLRDGSYVTEFTTNLVTATR